MQFALTYSRLAFDPLRAYAGPFLARFTGSYAGWHTTKNNLHLVTYLDHLRYGKGASYMS
ncbi:hypothetical protein F4677DRAFT_422208 [Hypoxylon crocopeplum]|nr:hypothetical protein F4677DRAFT_422208 [Hypoxylon crocopeplum]